MDPRGYAGQSADNAGFWASFHELVGGYPWLTKRVARVIEPAAAVPRRNPLAYLLAILVPYGGRAGGGLLGVVVLVALIGMLAAVALPAYQDYKTRTQVMQLWQEGTEVRAALGLYFNEHGEPPSSLDEAGAPESLAGGARLAYDSASMAVDVPTPRGTLQMVPSVEDGKLNWYCEAGQRLPERVLPAGCRRP